MNFDLSQNFRDIATQIMEGCRQIYAHMDYRAARGELRGYITEKFLKKYVPPVYGYRKGLYNNIRGSLKL